MDQIDAQALQSWIGKKQSRTDTLTPFPSNALAATLDRDDPPYDTGSDLPPLWHWLHFLDLFKLEDAGYDGHAALGSFLPPVPLPRRMWAGSRLEFHAPLPIGATLEKTSRIASVKHKSGKSGDLVFVTVAHSIHDAQKLCLSEEHDIVYRAPPQPDDPVREPPRAMQTAGFSRSISPDPVLLFRYSALTFNGHRIHYDHPFCVNDEGYGGLVVHGPLLATLMLDLLRRQKPDARVTHFEFRAQAPVFDTNDFTVEGAQSDDPETFDLWIKRTDGAEAMRGRATLACAS